MQKYWNYPIITVDDDIDMKILYRKFIKFISIIS